MYVAVNVNYVFKDPLTKWWLQVKGRGVGERQMFGRQGATLCSRMIFPRLMRNYYKS